jgi:hypothetical protein
MIKQPLSTTQTDALNQIRADLQRTGDASFTNGVGTVKNKTFLALECKGLIRRVGEQTLDSWEFLRTAFGHRANGCRHYQQIEIRYELNTAAQPLTVPKGTK